MTKHTMETCGSPITKLYCEDFCPDDCDKCPNWTPKKPQTNADRIRAMGDADIAHVLYLTARGGVVGQRTKDDWLDWLQQEATDD